MNSPLHSFRDFRHGRRFPEPPRYGIRILASEQFSIVIVQHIAAARVHLAGLHQLASGDRRQQQDKAAGTDFYDNFTFLRLVYFLVGASAIFGCERKMLCFTKMTSACPTGCRQPHQREHRRLRGRPDQHRRDARRLDDGAA